jgi:hypothetical protein
MCEERGDVAFAHNEVQYVTGAAQGEAFRALSA